MHDRAARLKSVFRTAIFLSQLGATAAIMVLAFLAGPGAQHERPVESPASAAAAVAIDHSVTDAPGVPSIESLPPLTVAAYER